jgi:predicted transcriptional regulator
MKPNCYLSIFLFFIALAFYSQVNAQGIFTARGYWEESNKETYRIIKQKSNTGIALTADETSYLQDFETYLSNYYQRLSEDEKALYAKMKDQWDRELMGPEQRIIVEEEFEWRGRDYATNIFYGA